MLAGQPAVSDVYLSHPLAGGQPLVAYLEPVRDAQGRVLCAAALYVTPDVFRRVLRSYNGLAGPGSYSVIYDHHGIRIAHSGTDSNLYHPAGPLDAGELKTMVAESRFGPETERILRDVRPLPAHFERARAERPDPDMYRTMATTNAQPALGVARRMRVAGWTVFYLSPESNLLARLTDTARTTLLLALGVMALALAVGLAFAHGVLRPVRALAEATRGLASGASRTRVPVTRDDELGQLATSFNTMADQLQTQTEQVLRINADLEQRVRERSGLLQAIVNNAVAVICVTDTEGRVEFVNEQFARLFGQAGVGVGGRLICEVMDAGTAAEMTAMDAQILAGAASVVREVTVSNQRTPLTLLAYKCPLRDATGRIERMVCIATDITERKAAESRLLAQLQRLRLLDEITTAVGDRVELRHIHEVVLRALEERLAADFCCILERPGDMPSLRVTQLGRRSQALSAALALPPGADVAVDANGLARCLGGMLVHESDVERSEYPFPSRLARAGMRSLVLAPLGPISGATGVLVVASRAPDAFSSGDCEFLRQLAGHLSLAQRQARLVEELRQANNHLRQSQQSALQRERLSALGQMASGIAHDINNAISPAALYAEALIEREDGLSPAGRRQLEVISRAVDDVSATVARMREFYRPPESASSLLPVQLNMLVQQVLDLTHARWSDMPQARGATIDLRLELSEPLRAVPGIESELREALINLVFNAVDAMPAGGQLTLRTRERPEDGHVELSVIDTGMGMDAATRARCLEPFFTTKGERGSGLGLAMVYGVAQRHGAQLDIDSTPGAGTAVHLRFLPAAGGPMPLAEAPSVAGPPRRILLVDDDALLLASVCDTLANDGHTVVTALGGQAGIDAFGSALASGVLYDVVITDLGMPHVDGYQVARAVKSAAAATPVLLLTGWGTRLGPEAEQGHSDIDHVLAKPPKLRDLRAALAHLAGADAGPPGASGP